MNIWQLTFKVFHFNTCVGKYSFSDAKLLEDYKIQFKKILEIIYNSVTSPDREQYIFSIQKLFTF